MGPSEITDQIDLLLEDKDITAMRRLTTPLVKMRKSADGPEKGATPWAATRRDQVHYLLSSAGDPGTYRDVISGDRRIKEMRYGLALVVFSLGEAAVEKVQPQARTKLLEDTWDEVVDVLQDPNNLARTKTGWIQSLEFTSSAPRQQEDRLVMLASFRARYYRQMGAM